MVSLNFQTPFKELQLNQGWFMRNGGCGYIRKPKCLLKEGKFKADWNFDLKVFPIISLLQIA